MKRKIVGILFCMLMIFNTTIPISSHIDLTVKQESNKQSYPDDFEFYAFGGGFGSWSDINIINIEPNGHGKFSKIYAEDKDTGIITDIDEFDLTTDQMDELWNVVINNDFFNLNSLYTSTEIDGTFCYILVKANNNQHSVETRNFPLPQFDEIIEMLNTLTPGIYDIGYNGILNLPPDKPSTPSGETSGKTGRTYSYTTQTNDPNDDPIYYLFDWGDNSDSSWIGPFESGETATAEHKWSSDGNYNISVMAKDDPNNDGDLSDGSTSRISDSLELTMPKGKTLSFIFNIFFKNILNLFPFLKNVIPIVYSSSLGPSGTTVTIEECDITVTINIQIWGPGATDDLADEIEADIESVWNFDKEGNIWFINCAVECVRKQPGCWVWFDADVKKVEPWEWLPGRHDIFVREDPTGAGYSTVDVTDSNPGDGVLDSPRPNDGDHTRGHWDNNEPAGTWAHEAGHLMGLEDQYTEKWEDGKNGNPKDNKVQDGERTCTPNKDHEDDIMATLDGSPLQSAVEAIVDMGGVKCPCECCPEENDTEEPNVNIDTPQNGTTTSSPVFVKGSATDKGKGIMKLECRVVSGSISGMVSSQDVDPPLNNLTFNVGPINLDLYIDPGDWITFIINATDGAGNIGSDEVTVIYESEEDNTPPVTEKIIGEPNEEGGYLIWPFTPITFEATDDMSGVDYVYYEVWWDSNEDGIVDMLMAEKTVDGSFVTFSVDMYGIFVNTIELRWYAVDNANNFEDMHYQQHYVTP